MAASATDKFIKVGEATATTLSAPGYTIGATSITVASTTNWPTDTGVIFAIDVVETVAGEEVAIDGTYCEFVGTVASATSITNVSLVNGTPQDYASGASTRVYISISSETQNRMVDGVLVEHNQDGTHSDITADSVTTDVITAPEGTIDDLTVTTLTVGSQTPTADWTALGTAPNTVTYNGNRSYTLVFNSTNYTGTINAGTRVRTTRTVAAPTQCTSLNGSTQYWVKTSPNKMTFTDDFVVSAWVKLSSYPGSFPGGQIISRYNGTSGFMLYITSSGQVRLQGFNGGIGNTSYVESYQSVPLGKWVHISVQLDMSAFTATTTTSYVMLDGVDVPVSVNRAGTNPTAIIQAGNLEVGSTNGGTGLFPGKIAQAAVFNAKVTQATMLTYISQGLIGTETSLASAYSFNGVTTDLNTTTPNDLSAGAGSPTATNADSPFGTQASGLISSTLDYGIVQTATFSTNTTVVVQIPEGNTIPTSGGVSAVSYSSAGRPYGFPGQKERWSIFTFIHPSARSSQSTAVSGTWYNIGNTRLSVTVGSWVLSHSSQPVAQATTATEISTTLSTGSSTASDIELIGQIFLNSGTIFGASVYRVKAITLDTQTIYYHNSAQQNGSSVTIYNSDNTAISQPIIIKAENAYL